MSRELLKQAFILGVIRAARDAGIEKTAVPGMISNWLSKIPVLGGLAKGYGSAVSKFSPTAQKYIRDTMFGGGLVGGMNVAFGDKETPWYQRAATGALGGAAGGFASRAGIEGARGIMGRMGKSQWLNTKAPNFASRLQKATSQNPAFSTHGGIWQYAKSGPGTMGETAKRYGMYALTGAPMAAASIMVGNKGQSMAEGAFGGGAAGGMARAGEAAAPGIRAPMAAAAERFGLSPSGRAYAY